MGWKKKGGASGIGGHLPTHDMWLLPALTNWTSYMVHKIETEVTNTQHAQMFLQPFQQGPNLLPKHLEERPSLS